MSDLKTQLIKLGSINPELRPHIREVLKVAAGPKEPWIKILSVTQKWLEDLAYELHMKEFQGATLYLDTMEWRRNELQVAFVHDNEFDMDMYLSLNLGPTPHVIVKTSYGRKFKLDVGPNTSAISLGEQILKKL